MKCSETALPALTKGLNPLAGIPSASWSSRATSAIKASGFRSSPRPRRLQERLQCVRDVANALPVSGREYAYAAPRVGPDLKVWAVPQWGEDGVRALGLSLPLNSQNRSRPGLSGISTHGKKQIRWSCDLMEDFRRSCAMWTVTLEDPDYIALSDNRKWPDFQRRVIDLLCRYLKSHGDPAVVIAAVEIGSKRFARTGRPDPHIHILTSGWGRRRPDGQWLLCPDAMDDLVAKACQYASLPSALRPAASRVEPVRHSVAAYMSKYLSKQLPVPLESVKGEWQELIPRQWWNQSEACKAMVEGCLSKLPPAFAAFLVRNQIMLENMKLGRGGMRVVSYKKGKCFDTPIEIFRFKFFSPESLHAALELFAVWAVNEEAIDARGLVMSG